MHKKTQQYFNIYVVVGFIGIFSLLYLFSFAFILNQVSSGSSRDIKKEYCLQNPVKCNIGIKKSRDRYN